MGAPVCHCATLLHSSCARGLAFPSPFPTSPPLVLPVAFLSIPVTSASFSLMMLTLAGGLYTKIIWPTRPLNELVLVGRRWASRVRSKGIGLPVQTPRQRLLWLVAWLAVAVFFSFLLGMRHGMKRGQDSGTETGTPLLGSTPLTPTSPHHHY
jgi:hypothetical protein